MKKTKFSALFISVITILLLILTINCVFAQKIKDVIKVADRDGDVMSVECVGKVEGTWVVCTYVNLQGKTVELDAQEMYMPVGYSLPSADFKVPFKRKSCTFTLWQKKVGYCSDKCAHCKKFGYHLEGLLDTKTIK